MITIEAAGGADRTGAATAPEVTVSFGYSAAEDRIVGVFAQGGQGATVLLTRRLVRQMVPRLAQLLEAWSPLAGRAPAGLRAEVVQMEHQGAVAELAKATGFPPAAAAVAQQGSPLLVTRADLTPNEDGHLLVLSDAGGRNVTVRLKQQDLHRIVGALHQQAAQAQWDLAGGASWLAGQDARPAN